VQSKGNAPTAAQKRWREAVRELGSIISGGPAAIHHPVGVTGKHNKVAIGHWWVIPLTDAEHKGLHRGELGGKAAEKRWFSQVYLALFQHPDKPVIETYSAIMDYHL